MIVIRCESKTSLLVFIHRCHFLEHLSLELSRESNPYETILKHESVQIQSPSLNLRGKYSSVMY